MPLAPPPPTNQDVSSRQYRDWFYSIYSLIGQPGQTLGTMAYQNANSVAITGGSIGGVGISGSTINNTPIGNATASTGAFTNLSSSGTLSGTGFTNYFASPPAIGSTTPNTGKFTNLQATGTTTLDTLTGYLKGTSGVVSASTTIPNTDITGLGTMSTQNANNVAITGGSINGTSVGSTTPARVNTNAFRTTALTGYLYGNSSSDVTASTTIPNTAITGLGTMSTQNANAVVITGGSIDGTTIGVTTPSRVNTNALKTTGLTGYLYGNDNTGDVTASTTIPYTAITAVPYGAFHDTTTQTASATTITAITFNSTDYSSNVALGSPTSHIVVSKSGTYSVTFSLQGANTASSVDNITVWFRINGTDVPTSAGISAIPGKHGSIDGQLVFGWTAFYTFAAGDYLQMMWTTDGGTSSLTTYPVGTSPVHPLSPSAAISLNYIAP